MVLQDMRGIDELGQWRCGSKLVNTEILHSAKTLSIVRQKPHCNTSHDTRLSIVSCIMASRIH